MNTRIRFEDMPFIDTNSMGRDDMETLFLGHLYDHFLSIKSWVDDDPSPDSEDLNLYKSYLTLLKAHLLDHEFNNMTTGLNIKE